MFRAILTVLTLAISLDGARAQEVPRRFDAMWDACNALASQEAASCREELGSISATYHELLKTLRTADGCGTGVGEPLQEYQSAQDTFARHFPEIWELGSAQ